MTVVSDMMLLKFVCLGLLVFGASSAFADMISPSHNCSRPIEPSQFATQADQAKYDRQVGSFEVFGEAAVVGEEGVGCAHGGSLLPLRMLLDKIK